MIRPPGPALNANTYETKTGLTHDITTAQAPLLMDIYDHEGDLETSLVPRREDWHQMEDFAVVQTRGSNIPAEMLVVRMMHATCNLDATKYYCAVSSIQNKFLF